MTTANKLTILRVILIPVFILLMYASFRGHVLIALVIFIAASLTDLLDGHIARKYHQVTNFGKFADPLADKLLVTAALIIFVEWNQIPAWIAVVIVAREFAVTGLRLAAMGSGQVIAAGKSGKIKTFVTMVVLCVMMTPLHGLYLIRWWLTVDDLGSILMLIVTVWSGAEYFFRHGHLLNMK